MEREVRFAFAGDLLISQSFSDGTPPELLRLVELIRSADLAVGNLEMLFHDFEGFPAAASGGTHLRGEPALLEELKWAGFRSVSLANNHVGDYGTGGMLAHLANVEASGLMHAGLGRHLDMARAPAFMDSAAGRVALISCTATFPSGTDAGRKRADVHGRPGVNPLRLTTVYRVDDAGMAAARTLQKQLGEKAPGPEAAQLILAGRRFQRSAVPGVAKEIDERDRAEILASIRAARGAADWVIFSLHAHQGEGGDRNTPTTCLREFSRAAVEAGADVVVGHGPHVLRGIEIHKGRPIFHSLGNFFFQVEGVDRFPSEVYEGLGLGPESTPEDVRALWRRTRSSRLSADPRWSESVLAMPIFRAGSLERIELFPVTLERAEDSAWCGAPRLAAGNDAIRILQRLEERSAALGTTVRIQGGRGLVA
ncbi:MAG TPA: CapA family protein [Verrucomicrobiae bacterium]|nr:CapA family protein [Verrucomicrobiae bacterium]